MYFKNHIYTSSWLIVCVCVTDGPILEYSLCALSLQLEEVWEPMSLYRCTLDKLSGVNS